MSTRRTGAWRNGLGSSPDSHTQAAPVGDAYVTDGDATGASEAGDATGASETGDATGASEAGDATGASETNARAFAFQLLGRLMLSPPDAALLGGLQSLSTGASADSPFAAHWHAMGTVAAAADSAALEQEYTDLFIGLGRGQVIPYGSWYVTGFLMDRPLAALRQDLERLGFTRAESASEPEDHVGAICEVLAMLIEAGDADKQFFNVHLAPWAKAFFRDLAEAPAADFYAPVARFGEALVDFETDYQKMLS